jgi:hypothetical protein
VRKSIAASPTSPWALPLPSARAENQIDFSIFFSIFFSKLKKNSIFFNFFNEFISNQSINLSLYESINQRFRMAPVARPKFIPTITPD